MPPSSATLPRDDRLELEVAYCVGGVLSPLMANVALSILDDHFAGTWAATMASDDMRHRRRRKGLATYRLVRYADDFVVLVAGTRAQAEALRDDVAAVLAPIGLRLSTEKTRIVHIDDGFDFLGFRIVRQRKRGSVKYVVYTYPSKAALGTAIETVRALTRVAHRSLTALLDRPNPVLRGWTNYFRHGVSKATFSYLGTYAWRRVVGWLRRRHRGVNWKRLRRRHLPRWRPTEGRVTLFNPAAVTVSRYRYRANRIPSPWSQATVGSPA